jgi:hypothetical protein
VVDTVVVDTVVVVDAVVTVVPTVDTGFDAVVTAAPCEPHEAKTTNRAGSARCMRRLSEGRPDLLNRPTVGGADPGP